MNKKGNVIGFLLLILVLSFTGCGKKTEKEIRKILSSKEVTIEVTENVDKPPVVELKQEIADKNVQSDTNPIENESTGGTYNIKLTKDMSRKAVEHDKNIEEANKKSVETNIISLETNKKLEEPNKKNEENGKVAYLTFDDSMSNNTTKILNTLKEYGVKATFFPNISSGGKSIEFEKSMLKRMADEGHAIGNHTYSHSYSYVYSSVDNYIADTNKLNNFIYETTGIRPDILRFPGGSNNQVSWKYSGKEFMRKKLIPKIREEGYQYFDWNVSSGDANSKPASKQLIIQNVLNGSRTKKHAIILMHQTGAKTTTADALPEIIEGLKKQGFTFATLNKNSYTVQFTK